MKDLDTTERRFKIHYDHDKDDLARLLKAVTFSFFLHWFLISLLIFNVKIGVTKNTLYRVTIRPLSLSNNSHFKPVNLPRQSLSRNTEIKDKKNTYHKEIKRVETVKDQTKQHGSAEDLKTLQSKQIEQTIQKPVPLPIASTSDPNLESKLEKEDILHTATALAIADSDKIASSESPGKDGRGTGLGGTGGSGFEGWGKGSGTGISSRGGFGKGGLGGSGIGFEGGGSEVSQARYAENPKPPYPLMAIKRGCEGRVVLQVEVLPNGRVGKIFLKESSKCDLLDQSALETVKKWRFIPALKDGSPISSWVIIPVVFQLKDASPATAKAVR